MSSFSDIKDMIATVKDLYEKGQAQDAQAKLLQLKDELLALKEENINMREELLAFREKEKIAEALNYDAPYYFRGGGEEREGPFCQSCYDSDGKLVRLIHGPYTMGDYQCKICSNFYGKGSVIM